MSEVCSGEQTFVQLRTGFRYDAVLVRPWWFVTVLPYAALWNLDPYAVHQAAGLKSRPRPHDVWFDFALRLKS